MAKGSLPASRAKMAMSLKGKSRHYHWTRIQPRHFLSTARQVGFSAERAKSLIHEVVGQAEQAVQSVEARIPADFPSAISESILGGVRQQVTVLAQGL